MANFEYTVRRAVKNELWIFFISETVGDIKTISKVLSTGGSHCKNDKYCLFKIRTRLKNQKSRKKIPYLSYENRYRKNSIGFELLGPKVIICELFVGADGLSMSTRGPNGLVSKNA